MSNERAGVPIQMVGDAPSAMSVDVTALYDPRDGRVVHLHHVITAGGATRRTPEEQQRGAREAAQRLGVTLDGLEVLHAPDFRPTAGSAYRVDITTRRLLAQPVETRKRGDLPPGSTGAGM
jgi:hypothetical protein